MLCPEPEIGWLTRLHVGGIISLLIFLLKKGEAVEANHVVCDTSTAEEVADAFRKDQHDLKHRFSDQLQIDDSVESSLTIVGKMYVRAPVSSNMMTTTVTVIRVIPLEARRMPVSSGHSLPISTD